MKNLWFFLVCLNAVFFGRVLHAESTGYEVEVIVFSYAENIYINSENWPEIIIQPAPVEQLPVENEIVSEPGVEADIDEQTSDAVILNAITDQETDITQTEISAEPEPIDYFKEAEFLSKDAYRLNKQAQAIDKNSRYTLMIHKAWKQAGLPREQAFPVHLNSLADKTDVFSKHGLDEQNSERLSVINEDKVEGDITLVMSRYLHINANFNFYDSQKQLDGQKEINQLEPVIIEKKYIIKLERRMKSKQINFIDHPLIGILVLATPFKIVLPEDLEAPVKAIYKTL